MKLMQLEQDMGLANDVARQSGVQLPLGKVAMHVYKTVIEKQPELAKKDFSSVYRFLQADNDGASAT